MAKNLLKLKQQADEAYFNSNSPIMRDDEYDALIEALDYDGVGCVPTHNKTKLPIWLGSLTKYTTDKDISNFMKKYSSTLQLMVQEKLDGISCLYVNNGHGDIKLYTRGNGQIGSNITHLLTKGLKLPRISEKLMVRGELVMSQKIFVEKYSRNFSNARNLVSGLVSKKDVSNAHAQDLDFVAYEVINEEETIQWPLSKQYACLEKLGFSVVYHRLLDRDYISHECLSDYLIRRKQKSRYQIDGIVITLDSEYTRNTSDNPKYSFAFKNKSENVSKAIVDKIIWNLSKCGKFKPQIFIKPIKLENVTISKATGHNAKYIVDNNIGPGATLLITRSGNVIPHVLAVLKPAVEKVLLPENSRWGESKVDLYVTEDLLSAQVIKQMVYFFTQLNVCNCKEKTLSKIYKAGFHTIESIIGASVEELESIEGIGRKLASKLVTSIRENITNATTKELLAALNAFGEGIGSRKLANLDLNNPDKPVPGLSQKTIETKILPVLQSQLDRTKKIKTLLLNPLEPAPLIPEPESEAFEGAQSLESERQIFVFTGFRDSALEKQISATLGKVNTSISKKTNVLVVDDKALSKAPSSKMLKAQSLGIKIITRKELVNLLTTNQGANEYDDQYLSSSED